LLLLLVSASFGRAQTAQSRDGLIKSPPVPDLSEIEFLERYCLEEVNRARMNHQLPALKLSDHLLVIARKFSRRMAEEGFFSHTDPEGRTVKDRTMESGIKFTRISENLLWIRGYLNPVPPAIERWIARDGTVYFTEIFID
jgi:uncharacterized protein YkwD